MSVYQFDPGKLPDSAFVPGALEHLVTGNEGRLLDPRRTPFRVVAIRAATGQFALEITAFEDRGATWELPFESVGGCQFAPGGALAPAAEISKFEDAGRRFDEPLLIPADPAARAETIAALGAAQEAAADWLNLHSAFLRSKKPLAPVAREGIPELWADLEANMGDHGVLDVEDAFATRYVRNPHSGELVKGHRIVLAEMGLVAFAGKKIRDPLLFDGAWSRARREHIVRRLAFVRAVFAATGKASVPLFRGFSCEGSPHGPPNDGFVSATLDFDVALSHFDRRDEARTGVLLRQIVPVERVFMTFLETRAMNLHYKEAEAVLLYEDGNSLF